MVHRNTEPNLEDRLMDLMNKEMYEEFSDFYSKCFSQLPAYEHIGLLLRACRYSLLSFLKKILSHGIDVNSCHPSAGYPPLFIAIRSSKNFIIEYLIREVNADVNWVCQKTGKTCLHQAIQKCDLPTVKLLIEYGTIINENHFFLSIIECFRHKDKEEIPLIIFDVLLSHRVDLFDDATRKRALDFILRRYNWPGIHRTDLILPLLQRISTDKINDRLSTSFDKCRIKNGNTHITQVCIIGSGPAGLMLAALLYQSGIDSIVLEKCNRSEVESNIRAGVLEQSTVNLLDEIGVSERLFRQGIIERNICIQFNGERITIPITEFTGGKVATCYGQHLVLQDLIKARISCDQRLWFDTEDIRIERHDVTDDGRKPLIKFRHRWSDEEEEIECDFIAGCDGSKGSCCRRSIPSGMINRIEHYYPYAWLSILAEAPPNGTEIVYGYHSQHGFAVYSFRSLEHTRLHLQVSLRDTLEDWPDEKIWAHLKKCLTPNDQSWIINEGPILQRALFPLHNSIHIPMQYKRLFLVGDAAHIAPPTAAKGLNLAVNDARILSQALIHYYENDQFDQLNSYTETCLPHIYQTQEFANYMTLLLHKLNIDNKEEIDQFEEFSQKARQLQVQHSKILQTYIANMYVR